MKIIKPYAEIIPMGMEGADILKHVERCGRVCYKSENKINNESAPNFVEGIIKNGHEAVLEHYSFTVRFVCDRGVSHEIVRHRIASFCQESTRYCNYGKEDEITVIQPLFYPEETSPWVDWKMSCQLAEDVYLVLLGRGSSPQEARSVLPNSLKTEVVMTANLREWRHFFKLRTAKTAHPQMREIVIPLLKQCQEWIPVIFDDIQVETIKNRWEK